MHVRAKELGIYAGARRRPGVVFEMPDGAQVPPWAEVVGPPTAEPTVAAVTPIPTTLSELTPKPKKRGRPPQTFREIANES